MTKYFYFENYILRIFLINILVLSLLLQFPSFKYAGVIKYLSLKKYLESSITHKLCLFKNPCIGKKNHHK